MIIVCSRIFHLGIISCAKFTDCNVNMSDNCRLYGVLLLISIYMHPDKCIVIKEIVYLNLVLIIFIHFGIIMTNRNI